VLVFVVGNLMIQQWIRNSLL